MEWVEEREGRKEGRNQGGKEGTLREIPRVGRKHAGTCGGIGGAAGWKLLVFGGVGDGTLSQQRAGEGGKGGGEGQKRPSVGR